MPLGRPQYRAITGSGRVVLGDVLLGLRDAGTEDARVVLLPDAATCEGRCYLFKDEDGKAKNKVLLQPLPGQTIDGAVNFRFKGNRYVCELYSDGSGWQLLRSGVP